MLPVGHVVHQMLMFSIVLRGQQSMIYGFSSTHGWVPLNKDTHILSNTYVLLTEAKYEIKIWRRKNYINLQRHVFWCFVSCVNYMHEYTYKKLLLKAIGLNCASCAWRNILFIIPCPCAALLLFIYQSLFGKEYATRLPVWTNKQSITFVPNSKHSIINAHLKMS